MLYSRSAEYAIRAVVRLARSAENGFVMAKTLAEQERIPAHFLAKILQDLARKGFLRSSKGPSGGFCLRIPASEMRLIDLVEVLDGPTLSEAAKELPWTLDSWKGIHSRIMEELGKTTVADIAREMDRKRSPKRAPAARRKTTR